MWIDEPPTRPDHCAPDKTDGAPDTVRDARKEDPALLLDTDWPRLSSRRAIRG